MNKKILLRLSSFLALVTFAAHTVGALSNHSNEAPGMEATYKLMNETYVHFPMGISRNITTLMLGANFCLSVYLFVAGVLFIILSSKTSEKSSLENSVILLNSLGLAATAVISAFYFFALPAIFLGLAAIIGIAATRLSK